MPRPPAAGARPAPRTPPKVVGCARAAAPGRVADVVAEVPEQPAARRAVRVVGDDAFAVRLLPVLDGLEPRIDLADGFVSEVEEVGVEEREVLVGLRRAGHVRADDLAMR